MKDLNAIALEVAGMDSGMGDKDTSAFTKARLFKFARRLVERLAPGAMDPVAHTIKTFGSASCTVDTNLPIGMPLYAAPVVPADMVLVPREPNEAMSRAIDLAKECGIALVAVPTSNGTGFNGMGGGGGRSGFVSYNSNIEAFYAAAKRDALLEAAEQCSPCQCSTILDAMAEELTPPSTD